MGVWLTGFWCDWCRLMLRLLQDLYNSDVVAMEDLIKWKDDVDDKTPDKVPSPPPPPPLGPSIRMSCLLTQAV